MPKENKIDKIELEKRIRIVQEWIIDDWSYSDIVTNIKTTWKLADAQAKRYIKLARERWVENEQEIIEQKRRLKVVSLKKLKRSLKDQYKGTPFGINAILRVEREIIRLEGLDPAKKIELTGPGGKPIQTENTNLNVSLTNEEIRQIAKQLEEDV